MSINSYSLKNSIKSEYAYNPEILNSLNSQLSKAFDNLINKLDSNKIECKELKNFCFAVVSKYNQALDQENSKNKSVRQNFENIQKEAAKE